jgi:hypothetical protein
MQKINKLIRIRYIQKLYKNLRLGNFLKKKKINFLN